MPAACALRNSRQVGAERLGAGPRPAPTTVAIAANAAWKRCPDSRYGEYEGRPTHRKDTCIVGIAVLMANALDALGFVPIHKSRPCCEGLVQCRADAVVHRPRRSVLLLARRRTASIRRSIPPPESSCPRDDPARLSSPRPRRIRGWLCSPHDATSTHGDERLVAGPRHRAQ